jgi:hypothetical protein
MAHRCTIALTAALCLLANQTPAQSLRHWELRYPGITSDNLTSVAFAANKHVAVGWAGTVLVSNDGVNWSRQNLDAGVDFRGVNYLNDKFFAVGKGTDYQGVIFTSVDGSDWVRLTLPPVSPLMDVAYGNGRYIAIGSGGYLVPDASLVAVQSVDGTNWSSFRIDDFYYATELRFWNSAFWATHWGGIRKSLDGRQWTQVLTNFPGVPRFALHENTLVAVGLAGQVRTSVDKGETWITRELGSSHNLYSVTYASGVFAAIGNGGSVFTSPDGLDWAARPINSDGYGLYYSINYGGGQFVTVGYSGVLAVSSNAVDWTHVTAASGELTGVAAGPDSVVAVGPGTIVTSSDGTTWSRQAAVTLNDVAYGGGQYVAVGNKSRAVSHYQRPNYNYILTSRDGFDWTEQTGVTNLPLQSVAYGNGMFMAAGGTGALNYMGACVIMSRDGVEWELSPMRVSWYNLNVYFGNGVFVVSSYHDFAISSDGQTWQRARIPNDHESPAGAIVDLTHGDGKFFALTGNRIYVSTNALEWQVFANLDRSYSGIMYGDGHLVVFGGGFNGAHMENSRIISTTDGRSWTAADHIANVGLWAGVFTGRSFFVVGESGTILESGPFPTFPFPARASGRYAGLFYESHGVYPQSSGYIKLRLARTGTVEGELSTAGQTHPFTATLNADTATASFSVGANVNVGLRLDLSNESDGMAGIVSADSWQADLIADRCPFDASNPAPFQGRYTLVVPPDLTSSGTPEGFGCASVRVNANGKVTMEGKLADNQRISQTTFISIAGDWPLYMPLHEGAGSFLGWMKFVAGPAGPALLNERISWIRPSIPGSRWFASGFSNEVAALASPYKLPASGRVLDWRKGVLTLSGGELPSALSAAVVLNANNVIVNASRHFVSGVIDPETGVFSGSIRVRGSGKTCFYRGAVLQNQQIGLGFFTGANSTGAVRLEPQAR